MKGNGKQNYGAADRARQHGTTVASNPDLHWRDFLLCIGGFDAYSLFLTFISSILRLLYDGNLASITSNRSAENLCCG